MSYQPYHDEPTLVEEYPLLTSWGVAAGAAACSRTLIAPTERIRWLLTNQDHLPDIKSGKMNRYTGVWDCFSRVCKEESFTALWTGNLKSLARYAPSQAFNFTFREVFKSALPQYNPKTNLWLYSQSSFLAGALAGTASLAVIYPIDVINTKYSTDLSRGRDRMYKNPLSCLVQTLKRGGFGSLYSGFGNSVQGIVVYRAFYFGLYDTMKGRFFEDERTESVFWRWVMAQVSTTVAGVVSYPFDTVRRRVMANTQKTGFQSEQLTNSWQCWKHIFRNEGFKGFFKGSFSTILRGIGGALVLVLYDEARFMLYD
ncbi:hypothetical protein FOZ61_000281 [Perkinsus olseni]|uniref:ADP/ATP translocase n=1 Tax=Perkinsus olseni TaxID=32597 RepID=A0A7J6KW62_PEROL|nr:hypothetical protein FOZ61_000281 [Perkinsus olseni]KAF4651573.1 hypothetical protein FOL46_000248 [Perkinsus olseni]